jgi:hypothetical protein
MGRILNPKKRKTVSRKVLKTLKDEGINVNYYDTMLSKTVPSDMNENYQLLNNAYNRLIENGIIKPMTVVEEPLTKFEIDPPIFDEEQLVYDDNPIEPNLFTKISDEELIKIAENIGFPDRCRDIWKDGDW